MLGNHPQVRARPHPELTDLLGWDAAILGDDELMTALTAGYAHASQGRTTGTTPPGRQTRRGAVRRRTLVPRRKSLSGGHTHSPRVQFRLPESLHTAAGQRADEEGVSLSVLAREALEHYLAS